MLIRMIIIRLLRTQSLLPSYNIGSMRSWSPVVMDSPGLQWCLGYPQCVSWGNYWPFYPVLVTGDILGIEQLIGRWVLAQPVLWCGAGVHEGLGYHGEAGICDAALVDVKYKLRVLDDIHPETQREAVEKGRIPWRIYFGIAPCYYSSLTAEW